MRFTWCLRPSWRASPSLDRARRRHHAGRLVQEDVGEPLRGELTPVELDAIARLDEGVQRAGLAVYAHAAGLDELVGAAPRGDARTREVGIEAHDRYFRCRAALHLAHALDDAGRRGPPRLARAGRGGPADDRGG